MEDTQTTVIKHSEKIANLERTLNSTMTVTKWFIGIQVTLFSGVFMMAIPWAWNLQSTLKDTTIKIAIMDEKFSTQPLWMIEKFSRVESNVDALKKDIAEMQKHVYKNQN